MEEGELLNMMLQDHEFEIQDNPREGERRRTPRFLRRATALVRLLRQSVTQAVARRVLLGVGLRIAVKVGTGAGAALCGPAVFACFIAGQVVTEVAVQALESAINPQVQECPSPSSVLEEISLWNPADSTDQGNFSCLDTSTETSEEWAGSYEFGGEDQLPALTPMERDVNRNNKIKFSHFQKSLLTL